jgi:hypothetical protein
MRKHVGLWLLIMTILVQLSVVVACQEKVEEPSVPSTEPAPTSKLPPASMPVPPPETPASINPPGFIHIGDLAAANTEVANVEAAAAAYYAVNGSWPSNTYKDLVEGGFLSKLPVYNYTFDSFGRVVVIDGTAWPKDSTITWSAAEHKWRR